MENILDNWRKKRIKGGATRYWLAWKDCSGTILEAMTLKNHYDEYRFECLSSIILVPFQVIVTLSE